MEPRALDRRRMNKRAAACVFAWLALAGQTWAVSLRDIKTDILENQGLTRCVIELSGETQFFERNYLADKKYFLVDIYNVNPAVAERFITPASGPVRQVLVLNRKDPDTRVLTLVFYLTDVRRYRVFSVNNPFRIVVDVWHSTEGLPATEVKTPSTRTPGAAPTGGRIATPSSALQPAPSPPVVTPSGPRQPGERYRRSGKKIVIIDPGHGGNDPGAESYGKVSGRRVLEKELNLTVAQELKRLFDASPNVEAFLTRSTDKYVSLGDRSAFCDNFYGDLFISIHCNATDSWRHRNARGLELYYLNPTGATKGSLRYLEEIENRNGNGKSDDGKHNWDHPIFRTLARESLLKWQTEGRIVCEYLKAAANQIPYYRRYNNRESTVQSAFFRVLFQAEMPSVLVEIGFLTNSQECEQLLDSKFQQQVATALYNGIISYFKARDERFEPKVLARPVGP